MAAKNNILLFGVGVVGSVLILNKLRKTMKSNTLTKNFTFAEFESKDGAPMPKEVKDNIKLLAKELEKIRAAFNLPLKINSGYRSPKHNKSIGGASDSQHMKGTAADFTIPGRTPKQIAIVIEGLIKDGKIKEGGLGTYNNWIHYDIRGKKARWNG